MHLLCLQQLPPGASLVSLLAPPLLYFADRHRKQRAAVALAAPKALPRAYRRRLDRRAWEARRMRPLELTEFDGLERSAADRTEYLRGRIRRPYTGRTRPYTSRTHTARGHAVAHTQRLAARGGAVGCKFPTIMRGHGMAVT